jgi:hypothetical protein
MLKHRIQESQSVEHLNFPDFDLKYREKHLIKHAKKREFLLGIESAIVSGFLFLKKLKLKAAFSNIISKKCGI